MKLSFFFLLASIHVSASIYSQDKAFNISIKDQAMREVFKQIEEKSDFRFFYNDEFKDLNKLVSLNVKNKKIGDVLDLLLNGSDVTYKILEKNLVVITPSSIYQHTVTGKVTSEEDGNGMPGVNVLIKGTTTGTITDEDGNYRLDVPSENAVLVFSFIGYLRQEIEVRDRTVIDVVMVQDVQTLEEVVVVGYGTQQKVNLTGSVSAIGTKELENKAVTKLSQAFSGTMPGVSITQNSGEPGEDFGDIKIRGVNTFQNDRGTLGKGNREDFGGFFDTGPQPLIIVDGIPGSLEEIDPNTIESISVLKDAASAAIYGARAANGVILVTTKRGREGQMEVNYNAYAGWSRPTEFPDYVDSWVYAEMKNEMLINRGQSPEFTDEQIQQMRNGELPYSNTNHIKDLFESGSGFQNNHNLSFRGGSEMTQYTASLSYLQQNGLIRENVFDRYNLQLNLDQKVSEKLNLETSILGVHNNNNEPVPTAGGGWATNYWRGASVRELHKAALKLPFYIPAKFPDGSYGHKKWKSPQAILDSKSFAETKNNYFLGNVGLEWEILESLKISGKMGYEFDQIHRKAFNAVFEFSPNFIAKPAVLREELVNKNRVVLQSLVQYTKSFNEHDIYVLGGFSQESKVDESFRLYREDFPNNDVTVIDAGSSSIQVNSGDKREWRLRSYFGRFRYSFADRYLFEANVRYDGSSRFPPTKKYGLFPSFSGGWIVSNESFFVIPWMNYLKLRGSWGELGNQEIGAYPYQLTLSLGADYIFGDQIQPGVALRNLANRSISWETTRMFDVGVDVSMFDNKLSLTADYYNKKTRDLLYPVEAAAILGLTPSEQNAGEVLNRGWEFQLTHRNNIGNLYYSISPNISTLHNEVLKLSNVGQVITRYSNDFFMIMRVGDPVHAFYGYESDGLFVDQNDIDNYATQNRPVQPGDVRNKDISGPDGVPDGQVDPVYDRTVLGTQFPRTTFGLSLTGDYNGFDFSILVQGHAGVHGILRRQSGWPFNAENLMTWQLDRWTPENPDRNATVPRYGGKNTNTRLATGFWTKDASYARLKDVEIGYTFPNVLTDKVNIRRLRVYVSGRNIKTWDNYYEGYDPEVTMEDDNRYYPPTGVYTVGINLGF